MKGKARVFDGALAPLGFRKSYRPVLERFRHPFLAWLQWLAMLMWIFGPGWRSGAVYVPDESGPRAPYYWVPMAPGDTEPAGGPDTADSDDNGILNWRQEFAALVNSGALTWWSGGSFKIDGNSNSFLGQWHPAADPDTDHDGIPDSLDPYPEDPSNNSFYWPGGPLWFNDTYYTVRAQWFAGSAADTNDNGVPDGLEAKLTNWTDPRLQWWEGGSFLVSESWSYYRPQGLYGYTLTDSDGDGIPDCIDPFPADSWNGTGYWWGNADFFVNGILTHFDFTWHPGFQGDRDGDGIPDDIDPWPDDVSNNSAWWDGGSYPIQGSWQSFPGQYHAADVGDRDGDGIPDDLDPYPDDSYNRSQWWEGGSFVISGQSVAYPPGYYPAPPDGYMTDQDGDGLPDGIDPFPADPNNGSTPSFYWQGGWFAVDNLSVFWEAGYYPGFWIDSDGDGIPDSLDGRPGDAGNGNTSSFRWDGGTFTVAGSSWSWGPGEYPGTWNDRDGDGIPDSLDPYPDDARNANPTTFSWAGGTFVINGTSTTFAPGNYEGPVDALAYDSDGDGIPDALDPYGDDAGNNSFWWQGGAFVLNGQPTAYETGWYMGPANALDHDEDGDGIPDCLDPYLQDPLNHSFWWPGGTFLIRGQWTTLSPGNYAGAISTTSANFQMVPGLNADTRAELSLSDRDGDGIPDDADPYPDDPWNSTYFTWPASPVTITIADQPQHFAPVAYGGLWQDGDGDGIPDVADPYPADFYNANDSDQDGIPDSIEVQFGLSPTLASDAQQVRFIDGQTDELTWIQAYRHQAMDHLVDDGDTDGMSDAYEIRNGLDPIRRADAVDAPAGHYVDADGNPDTQRALQMDDLILNLEKARNNIPINHVVTDPAEYLSLTGHHVGEPLRHDPWKSVAENDWDGDGVSNIDEVLEFHTDPRDPQSRPADDRLVAAYQESLTSLTTNASFVTTLFAGLSQNPKTKTPDAPGKNTTSGGTVAGHQQTATNNAGDPANGPPAGPGGSPSVGQSTQPPPPQVTYATTLRWIGISAGPSAQRDELSSGETGFQGLEGAEDDKLTAEEQYEAALQPPFEPLSRGFQILKKVPPHFEGTWKGRIIYLAPGDEVGTSALALEWESDLDSLTKTTAEQLFAAWIRGLKLPQGAEIVVTDGPSMMSNPPKWRWRVERQITRDATISTGYSYFHTTWDGTLNIDLDDTKIREMLQNHTNGAASLASAIAPAPANLTKLKRQNEAKGTFLPGSFINQGIPDARGTWVDINGVENPDDNRSQFPTGEHHVVWLRRTDESETAMKMRITRSFLRIHRVRVKDGGGNLTTDETTVGPVPVTLTIEPGEYVSTQGTTGTIPNDGTVSLYGAPESADQEVVEKLVPLEIAVDANRDGKISFDGMDSTSREKPFEFWLNDDHDIKHLVDNNGLTATVGQEDLDDGVKDSADDVIRFTRDLEDFARIHVDFSPLAELSSLAGLSFRLEIEPLSGEPGLRLFRAIEEDGGLGYVFDNTTAETQIASNDHNTAIGLLSPKSPGGVSLSGSPEAKAMPNPIHFLFEGVEGGLGQLRIGVYKGDTLLGKTAGPVISLKSIRAFYQRWTANEADASGIQWSAWPSRTATPEPGNPTFILPPPIEPEKDFILFVHGWNMAKHEKRSFSETAYKRLWQLGYRGRFGAFFWPTFYATSISELVDPRNFDGSEHRAWESSDALLQLLEDLNAKYPGRVHLLAHSMGNVVASEALLKSKNIVVANYIASQAAIPADVFQQNPDITETWSTVFLRTLTGHEREFPGVKPVKTPNVYAYYYPNGKDDAYRKQRYPEMGEPYMKNVKGASRWHNFYNPDDWALGLWIYNQCRKPHETEWWETIKVGAVATALNPLMGVPTAENLLVYSYAQRRYEYRHFSDDRHGFMALGPGLDQSKGLYLPEDRYEIFSYCAQARCNPLGRQINAGPMFAAQRSLSGFEGTHPGHSAQFLESISYEVVWSYWIRLMNNCKVDHINISL